MESLEDRKLLDATGLAFGNAAFLTLSFVPDGTEAGGHSSQLHGQLNSVASQDEWQQTILTAFQQWARHTNADIGLVHDEGLAFGTAGATTRDDRFGDIRIGSIPLDSQVAAISVSHDQPISGTWVGDVLLNSNANISSLDELHSIVLHEAGHVFGLGHSNDESSIMYVHGGGGATELNDDDINRLRKLYGTRADDVFEFSGDDTGNDTLETAAELEFEHPEDSEVKGYTPSLVYGDITRSDDVDTYVFEAEDDYSGAVTFSLRVDGISQLRPTATVFSKDGAPITSGQLSAQGRIKITVPAVKEDLYFQVAAAENAESIFRIGGYSLVVTMDDRLITDAQTIEDMSDGRLRLLSADDLEDLFEDDGSESPFIDAPLDANDSFSTATTLKTAAGFDRGFRYIEQSSIQLQGDRDFFSFRSPDSADDVFSVHVRPNNGSTLVPKIRLYDRNEQRLPATILANGEGDLIVQVTGAEPDKNYVIEVLSDNNRDPFSTGNYELTIVFGSTATSMETVVTGNFQADVDRQQASLFVAQDQFFHFVLENKGRNGESPMTVMRIFDAADTPVFQLAAQPGKTRSGQTIRLGPGEYHVVVDGVFLAADTHGSGDFTVSAAIVSDPLAVPLDDPADDPAYQCEGVVGEYCYPGGIQTFDLFFFSPLSTSVSHTSLSQTEVAQLFHNDWWTWRAQTTSDAPADDSFESYGGQRLEMAATSGVLANEHPNGSELTVHLITPTAHGDIQLQPDGSFIYEPEPGFFGSDSFVYLVTESVNGLGTAIATVDVIPPIPGDANLDRTVDALDLAVWQANRFRESTLGFREGDFNHDGYVDGSDFNAWLSNRFIRAETVPAQRPRAPKAPLADNDDLSAHANRAIASRRERIVKRREQIGHRQLNLVDSVFADRNELWHKRRSCPGEGRRKAAGMKDFSIRLAHSPGELADVTNALSFAGVIRRASP